jgi:hypothetical protein
MYPGNRSTLICIKKRNGKFNERMGHVHMRKCIGLLILVMSVTGVSAAQVPGGNVYLGYTYLTSGSLSSGPLSTRHDLSNLNGVLVSGELKLLPWISGVAEYGANFGTETVNPFCEAITPCPVPFRGDTRMQTFLFGPRASLSIGGFRPFAHLLLGGAHLSQSLSVPVSGANFSGSEPDLPPLLAEASITS